MLSLYGKGRIKEVYTMKIKITEIKHDYFNNNRVIKKTFILYYKKMYVYWLLIIYSGILCSNFFRLCFLNYQAYLGKFKAKKVITCFNGNYMLHTALF